VGNKIRNETDRDSLFPVCPGSKSSFIDYDPSINDAD
jgi:hypothetical protein